MIPPQGHGRAGMDSALRCPRRLAMSLVHESSIACRHAARAEVAMPAGQGQRALSPRAPRAPVSFQMLDCTRSRTSRQRLRSAHRAIPNRRSPAPTGRRARRLRRRLTGLLWAKRGEPQTANERQWARIEEGKEFPFIGVPIRRSSSPSSMSLRRGFATNTDTRRGIRARGRIAGSDRRRFRDTRRSGLRNSG